MGQPYVIGGQVAYTSPAPTNMGMGGVVYVQQPSVQYQGKENSDLWLLFHTQHLLLRQGGMRAQFIGYCFSKAALMMVKILFLIESLDSFCNNENKIHKFI